MLLENTVGSKAIKHHYIYVSEVFDSCVGYYILGTNMDIYVSESGQNKQNAENYGKTNLGNIS